MSQGDDTDAIKCPSSPFLFHHHTYENIHLLTTQAPPRHSLCSLSDWTLQLLTRRNCSPSLRSQHHPDKLPETHLVVGISYPLTGYLTNIYLSNSNMEATTELKVLRISSKPSEIYPISITKVPLINVGFGGISEDKYKIFEKELGHIPDMDSFNTPGTKTFSWDHRTLYSLKNKHGTYMMYVCQDKNAGLRHNEYLEKRFKDIGTSPRAPLLPQLVVFGDVCIFKMKTESKTLDEPQKASYIDMDEGFAEKAVSEYGSPYFTLQNLLIFSPARE